MCDLSTEETAAVWTVTIQTARRSHRCDACQCEITPRQGYRRTKVLYDGRWATEKACAECSEALQRFGELHRFTPSASAFHRYLAACVRWDSQSERYWGSTLRRLEERLAQSKEAK